MPELGLVGELGGVVNGADAALFVDATAVVMSVRMVSVACVLRARTRKVATRCTRSRERGNNG